MQAAGHSLSPEELRAYFQKYAPRVLMSKKPEEHAGWWSRLVLEGEERDGSITGKVLIDGQPGGTFELHAPQALGRRAALVDESPEARAVDRLKYTPSQPWSPGKSPQPLKRVAAAQAAKERRDHERKIQQLKAELWILEKRQSAGKRAELAKVEQLQMRKAWNQGYTDKRSAPDGGPRPQFSKGEAPKYETIRARRRAEAERAARDERVQRSRTARKMGLNTCWAKDSRNPFQDPKLVKGGRGGGPDEELDAKKKGSRKGGEGQMDLASAF